MGNVNEKIQEIWKNHEKLESQVQFIVPKVMEKTSKLNQSLLDLQLIIHQQKELLSTLVLSNLLDV